jgi:hypothetical protein
MGKFLGAYLGMIAANCNDPGLRETSHSAARARAAHGRTQTNKTTTMIPISAPAIASIPASRMPNSLVIFAFTFEVRGSGMRREEGMSALSVVTLGHASAHFLVDGQRGPFDFLCLCCD